MATFLSSLLSELKVQHSFDAIVIACDSATLPARSLRKRTAGPSIIVSSNATNIHSQSFDDINEAQTTKLLPVIYDDAEIIVLSTSPCSSRTKNKTGGTWQPRQKSPSSVLCVNDDLHTMSPRSSRWCCSSIPKEVVPGPLPDGVLHGGDSALTCPKRPGFLDL